MDTIDLVTAICEYEVERLGEAKTLDLFQALVTTGLAWTLQGHYGREATRLLDAGLINWSSDGAA